MSTIYPVDVACARCGHSQTVKLADSVNVQRAPWMREAVLEGEFHKFQCEQCREPFLVEKELLYTDFDRKQWIGMFPTWDAPRFVECGDMVTQTFREALFERAPRFLANWAPGFDVRVVFGMAELEEKVLCWDRGLDDRVLEMLKLDVLADRPEMIATGTVSLLLDEVFADGGLGFLPVRRGAPPDPKARAVYVPRPIYDEVAKAMPRLAEPHAALFAGPYVNLLRYLFEKSHHPESGTPRSSDERRIWRPSRA